VSRRPWIAAALALPVLVAIAHAAWLDPRIEFLRPSRRGSWIVHPDPRLSGFFATSFRSADVRFSRSFTLDAVPHAFELHVTALDRFELTVNGAAVAVPGAGGWKRGRAVDLAPRLRRGANRIEIRVSYAQGVPALLVEGRGEARSVSSDRHWQATQPGEEPVPAARALRDEVFLRGRGNLFSRPPLLAAGWWLLVLAIAFGAYALVPARFKPWLRRARPPAEPASWSAAERSVWGAVFAVVAALQLHAAVRFEARMPDGPAHVAYVDHVAEHWRAPLAEQGWQMYHPPLFYAVAAALRAGLSPISPWFSSVVFLQLVNTGFGLASLACSGLLLRRLLPRDRAARGLAFVLVATLPMTLVMNSQVTNEVLAGSLVSCTLLVASRWLFDGEFGATRAALLGGLCGLALLAKFSGLFVLVSILTLLGLRAAGAPVPRRLEIARRALLLLAVAAALAGWFYLRNWLRYGDPFVGNWDSASGFHYEQTPGYRTAGFYLRFGEHLWHLPEWSRWSGFWEGLYGTLWADAQGFVVPHDDARGRLVGSLLLWLALLPTLAIITGLVRAVRLLLARWDHPLFLLVTTSLWTLGAIVLFSLEVPFFSTVCAFFGLSLLPALAVFAGLGLERLGRNLGRLRVVLVADVVAIAAAALWLFGSRWH